MRFFVKAEVFEQIHQPDDVSRLRKAFAEHVETILMPSGKVEMAGVFADARCPFFILNVDSSAELMGLLGGAMVDHFRLETHPICTLDELKDLFAREV